MLPTQAFLGDRNIEVDSPSLNRYEGAALQGEHRLDRGVKFIQTARRQASALEVAYTWRLKCVDGMGHSNSGIAEVAAPQVTR